MIKDYFYLRQRIPILLYAFYTQYKEVKDSGVDNIIKIGISVIGLVVLYAFMGLISKIPISKLIHLRWEYSGILTWGIFFLVYYYFAQYSNLNKLTAFTFSTLATVGGGWLYEIPFYHPLTMFVHYNTIFYINGQIVCLILLFYELGKMGLKLNKLICITLFLFLSFSWVLFTNWLFLANALDAIHPNLLSWTYRIPTCMFLISLLGGIEKPPESFKQRRLKNV